MDDQPIITLENLTKSYGDKQVLKGIDLTVMPGKIIGYIGPNGAGKTTTVKILIGMLGHYEGRATVAGFDVRTHSLEVKRRIGYVPESAAIYDTLTPLEYLRFLGGLYGVDEGVIVSRAKEMLSLFGLEKNLDDRMSSFSKGMRQKVLIVAGMIHNPDVLFMDEPLSGLDANSAVTVKEIFARLAEIGKTIFYCSHIMDVVERVCDRIIILSNGQIAADGSFEELRQMNKEESLERIFTQLTSEGEQDVVASQFIQALSEREERVD